jgi:hypothetical protein
VPEGNRNSAYATNREVWAWWGHHFIYSILLSLPHVLRDKVLMGIMAKIKNEERKDEKKMQ